jgi:hypothetical protein
VAYTCKIFNVLDGHVKTQPGVLLVQGKDEESNLLAKTTLML